MPLEKLSESIRGKKDPVAGSGSLDQTPETTDEMPVVPHKVLYAGIPCYSDKECTQQVEGVSIYVLQPLESDGFPVVDVVPSRLSFEVGQYLTWRLNKDELWEDCYYRNPDTGMIEKAWTIHVEFVGRVVSDQSVAGDQERLTKLEADYRSRQSPETVM